MSRRKGEAIVHLGMTRPMTEAMVKGGKAREALRVLEDIIRHDVPLSFENKVSSAMSLGACYSSLRQYTRPEKHYLSMPTMPPPPRRCCSDPLKRRRQTPEQMGANSFCSGIFA